MPRVNRCNFGILCAANGRIHGQLIVEYDGDTGEEYAFTFRIGPDGYHVIEESLIWANSRVRKILAAEMGWCP